MFLSAPRHRTKPGGATAHIEHAHPFWRMELVPTQRHEVHIQRIHIADHETGVPGQALGGVAGELHIIHANFVVRVHDADKNRVGANGVCHIIHRDTTIRIHGQIRHFEPKMFFQLLHRLQNGFMFDWCCDQLSTAATWRRAFSMARCAR